MPVTYDGLMSLESIGDEFTYTDRETMLYALGVGMSRDPMNEDELRYTYENDLKTVPTLASVIAWAQRTIGQSGINYLMVVHGEQRLTLHQPLPASA
ncbi:MAG: 3-alpha,7-alpha,12-alpha-trihydroxy-5-beta-cholest-24-enoyl-CoA hydratase, partial [Micropepsaceae bacterium]